MIDREIANYKLFEKEGSIQYPFYTTISGASAEEGNWVSNPFYLVQSRGVWYKGIPVE
jgi:hypothetical protein